MSNESETTIEVFKDYAEQEQVEPEVDYETLSKELKELTFEASVLKLETEKLEGELKSKKAKLESINQTLLRTLELLELDTIKAHGFTFFKETRVTVTTPKTLEEKTLLFDFLKEKGLFMQLASVNSQSLNALYKSLSSEALESGEIDFDMAGLKTSEYTSLKMRKAK